MASSGAIRGGQVYVEIGADTKKVFAAFDNIKRQMGKLGSSLKTIGSRITASGLAGIAPFGLSIRQGAKFEDVLLGIRASTGATVGDLDRVKAAAMTMSQALGVGPTEAAQGMLALLKAGMELDDVLGGAGVAALQFAKVGELDVATAAETMKDAMNVFKVSGTEAANILSAAADSSSTSIEGIVQAFAQSSAQARLSNQSMTDLAAALAIMANAGVKGSDAGTSIKTMLQRLSAPADDAAQALAAVGLSTMSFRNADGSMKPMVEIIRTLTDALQGMDQAAKDDIFRRIFGQDAIRAAAILTAAGVDGFQQMTDAMGGAMSVGDKFKAMMSGLSGSFSRVMAALQRLAIAVSDAVGPAFAAVMPYVTGFIDGLARLVQENGAAVANVAKLAVGAVVLGGALTGVGFVIQSLAGGLGVVSGAMKAVLGIGFSLAASFYNLTAGVVLYAAKSIAAATATAAAWAASNPLLLAAGVAVVGLGAAAAYAFGGIPALTQAAGNAIGSAFSTVVADAKVVFSDLYGVATKTFGGISDAIAAGDLMGAAEVLWLGLTAGWLRGQQAIMSYFDPWIETLQNAWGDFTVGVMNIVDPMWTVITNAFNTAGAALTGVMDNVINGLLATWDGLEAGIRKAWARIQKLLGIGKKTREEASAIAAEMKSRADKRAKDRPGVKARLEKAAAQNQESMDASVERGSDRIAANQQAQDARAASTAQRAAKRQTAVNNANAALDAKTAELAADRGVSQLMPDIGEAKTLDDIRALQESLNQLQQAGASAASIAQAQAALDDQQLEVDKQRALAAQADEAKLASRGGPQNAPPSQAEAVGTFSAMAASGMGFGNSLQERIAKAAEETAKNTRGMNEGGSVAA